VSRTKSMRAVIDHYPELAQSGVPFAKIVEHCCLRIPRTGIVDGNSPEDVLEAACEDAVAAIADDRLRGAAIANYVVAAFKRMAAEGLGERKSLSRVGLHRDIAEMQRLLAESDEAARRSARKPRSTPDLAKHALATLRPRPDIHDLPRDGLLVRPPLKANPYRDIPTERCEPLADALPLEALRENAAAAHESESRTKAIVDEHARRRAVASHGGHRP
jgi:hypothetical protein